MLWTFESEGSGEGRIYIDNKMKCLLSKVCILRAARVVDVITLRRRNMVDYNSGAEG